MIREFLHKSRLAALNHDYCLLCETKNQGKIFQQNQVASFNSVQKLDTQVSKEKKNTAAFGEVNMVYTTASKWKF